jgi:hypothetical protein
VPNFIYTCQTDLPLPNIAESLANARLKVIVFSFKLAGAEFEVMKTALDTSKLTFF